MSKHQRKPSTKAAAPRKSHDASQPAAAPERASLPATSLTPEQAAQVSGGTLASRYLGETEKSLNWVFNPADPSGASLLLDGSDDLFGR